MSSEYDWLLQEVGLSRDPAAIFALARQLEAASDFHLAATAYDQAFGLDPSNPQISTARRRLLEQLAITEHGIRFAYIPAGTFLMGSDQGQPDEKPVHPVQLRHFWLAETPTSWEAHCRIANWELPPEGLPKGFDWEKIKPGDLAATLPGVNQLRLQYCEDGTTRAVDWHAHVPEMEWTKGDGQKTTSRESFGEVPRENPTQPWGYDQKPVISVSLEEIELLCQKITTPQTLYRLPTEAEWEKAARGGLVGKRFPWGNDAPTQENCDFDRFDQFSIQPSRRFSPNDYGLYAMAGGVWEWVGDWYDAEYYAESKPENPEGPEEGCERVLRGGSWSDCAEVQTVSYRGARPLDNCRNPNIGFRLCRVEAPPQPATAVNSKLEEPQLPAPVKTGAGWFARLGRLFSGAK